MSLSEMSESRKFYAFYITVVRQAVYITSDIPEKTTYRSLPFEPVLAKWEEEFLTLQLKATTNQ